MLPSVLRGAELNSAEAAPNMASDALQKRNPPVTTAVASAAAAAVAMAAAPAAVTASALATHPLLKKAAVVPSLASAAATVVPSLASARAVVVGRRWCRATSGSSTAAVAGPGP